MKVYIFCLALFGVAFGEVAKFTRCDESNDDICEVKEVRVTPCNAGAATCALTLGSESSIEFDFVPKFAASQLTSTLFWASPGGDVPFSEFSNVAACAYTSCPTQPDVQQQLAYSLRLSKKLPTGKFTFKWQLWDANDKSKKCCFKTNVKLLKDRKTHK
ncbi:MD-2-related lipid-recognition protein-like [Bicyclus anynana]|uniref:MD-2-related lipid-recognition protein-like n=1 Tax=Bicyclus anynana TaxID=110368 RepID=A0A6J1MY08_BICAN|nr:MD-2-related lipid-recognition protein-like [Bicyclus anynana]